LTQKHKLRLHNYHKYVNTTQIRKEKKSEQCIATKTTTTIIITVAQ